MWYLLRDDFWVQWINVFVFARQVHSADSDLVNVRIFQHLIALLHSQVCIKNRHCEEVSPRRALERSCDFDHPVDHFSAILLANIMLFQRRFSSDCVALHEIFVDLLEQSQLEVLPLLRRRLLRAHETLLALLTRPHRASIARSRHIFHANDVLFHGVYRFTLFLVVARSGRDRTSCLGCCSSFGPLRILPTGCCIYSKHLAITTWLSSHHHILNRTAAIIHVLLAQLWRFSSSYILTRGRSCRCLHHHLLLKLRRRLLVLFLGRCVQTTMYLDWLPLRSLNNRMARSFLWPVLGTHAWLRLYSSVRAGISVWNLDLLTSILRTSLSHHSMSRRTVAPLSTVLHHDGSI